MTKIIVQLNQQHECYNVGERIARPEKVARQLELRGIGTIIGPANPLGNPAPTGEALAVTIDSHNAAIGEPALVTSPASDESPSQDDAADAATKRRGR